MFRLPTFFSRPLNNELDLCLLLNPKLYSEAVKLRLDTQRLARVLQKNPELNAQLDHNWQLLAIYGDSDLFFKELAGVELSKLFDRHGNSPLYFAAFSGDLKLCTQLVQKVGALLSNGNPLEVAAKCGHSQIIALLLEAGCPRKNSQNESLIHWAAEGGDLKTLHIALKADPFSAQKIDHSGNTLLHFAARSNSDLMVAECKRLYSGDAGLNVHDQSPRHVALNINIAFANRNFKAVPRRKNGFKR